MIRKPTNIVKVNSSRRLSDLSVKCGDYYHVPVREVCEKTLIPFGCTFDCKQDVGFLCNSTTGFCNSVMRLFCLVLTHLGICGDGIVRGTEECDDGNTESGDGCSSNCTKEDGFGCPIPGKPCMRM